MKKYKFITIRPLDDELFREIDGRIVYGVYSNKGNDELATLTYYPRWHQYVFEGAQGAVFNNSCLRDVLDFMETQIPIEIRSRSWNT